MSSSTTVGAGRSGILIILSSPSGAGKSTLSRRLLEVDPNVRFSISATTRPPRPGESEGRDYFFKSRREFERMVEEGEMLEHAEVFGNLYGTPRAPVEAAIARGEDVLFDVDWQGGKQIRESSLRRAVVSIFILPPSIAALESRLKSRGQD
jgi:guanylate kinase